VDLNVSEIQIVNRGTSARAKDVLLNQIHVTQTHVGQEQSVQLQELAMPSVDANQDSFQILIPSLDANLNVSLTLIAKEDLFVKTRNVLRSQILVSHLHVVQVLTVP